MINLNFWRIVKEKWIREEDPTFSTVQVLVSSDSRTTDEINAINQRINGPMSSFSTATSLEDINSMMEQLNELGVDDLSFDALFADVSGEE